MGRKIHASFWLIMFLGQFWLTPLTSAQTPEVLNLPDALKLAYQHNPRLAEARENIKVAQGDLLSARTLANPEIEAEIGGLKKDGQGRRNGNLDTLAVKQSFAPPGVRYLESQMARNEVSIRNESLKSVWSEVYFEVRTIYARVVLDKKELELKKSNLKAMRQFFSNVQLRYQSGQTLKNNLQRARIELSKTESDYLKAETDLNIDKARLNLVLGRARDVQFDIKDELAEEKLELDLDGLIAAALANRPDVKIEETEFDSKEKNVRQKRLNRLPSYSVGFQRTDEDDVEDYAALVEISIPLWDLNNGELKKSKAQREAQRIKLEALKNEVAFDVYVAYEDARLALKQLALFKKSLEESHEMFRLAGLRYKEGEIDFINYLDQVKASLDSRMQYYHSLYQLNQSISALEKSIYSSLRGEEFLQ